MGLFNFFKKNTQQVAKTEENCIKSNEKRDALDEMDATQDAAAIWEMMKKFERDETELNSFYFKKRAYNKLSTSKDSYTCRLLGENTFSFLEENFKDILIEEISQAYISQVEDESIESLELAKMVARQEKILDYDTVLLLKKLLSEKKIYRKEFFEPEWINNPKIWEQTNYKDREYLIKLKIFLETAPIHTYVNKNGQSILEVLGEEDIFSLWETLISKYDNVNELKAFLSGFSDD
ncbi:MAG: hypothetical protein E7348_01760 [Clostridiales bacterium]|nr:hypothetical protein [Clostridiales bacterium]